MNPIIESLVPVFSLGIGILVFLGLLNLGYRVIKYGGYKNATFGGKIEKTYGEVSALKKRLKSRYIKIHKLSDSGKTLIGLEITRKDMGGTQMEPLIISKEETIKLITFLEQAVNENYS